MRRSSRTRWWLAAAWLLVALLPTVTVAQDLEVREVSVPAGHVIRAPNGDVYVSIRGTAGPGGNSVARFDPVALRFDPGRTMFVGSEPGRMAIDSEGMFLYVALDGAGAVRRVRLDTFESDLEFPLGLGPGQFDGPRFASDLTVLQGIPRSVAVARTAAVGFFAGGTDVAVYDDGVRRPGISDDHWVSSVTSGTNPDRVYGYAGATSGYDFVRYQVDADGISVVDATSDLVGPGILGAGTTIVAAADRVYATNGRIIDPERLLLLGLLPGTTGTPTAISPDPEGNRIYLMDGNTLRTYDATTFALLRSFPVVGLPADGEFCCETGIARDLVHVGPDRFVFRTTEDTLVVIGPSFAPCTTDEDCADVDACTVDRCADGACEHAPRVCGDGVCIRDDCNPKYGCVEAPVQKGTACTTDDDPCTVDACDGQGMCTHVPYFVRAHEQVTCHIARLRDRIGALGGGECDQPCAARLDQPLGRSDALVRSGLKARKLGTCTKALRRAGRTVRTFVRMVRKLERSDALNVDDAGALQIEAEEVLGLLIDPRSRCSYRPAALEEHG